MIPTRTLCLTLVLIVATALPCAAQGPDSWKQLPDLPVDRIMAGSVTVDGVIYLFGGIDNSLKTVPGVSTAVSDQTWAYNPATPQLGWKEMARMPQPVAGMGVAVINGKIYSVCGGDRDEAAMGAMYVFDPAAGPLGTWSSAGPDGPLIYAGVCGAIGGKIYLSTGTDGVNYYIDTREFDPVTKVWTDKAALPIDPAWTLAPGILPPGMESAFGGVIGGKLYVAGGMSTFFMPDGLSNVIRATFEFDPAAGPAGTWTRRADMPDSVIFGVYNGASAVSNGHLFCLGGQLVMDSEIEPFTYTLEFEPPSGAHPDGRWFNRAYPIEETEFPTAVEHNGDLYLMGNMYDTYINHQTGLPYSHRMCQKYTPSLPWPAGPFAPMELRQFDAGGVEILPASGSAPGAAVTFKGLVNDRAGGNVRLEIEVVAVDAPFTEIPTVTSDLGPSRTVSISWVPPGNGSYRWRARTANALQEKGPWQPFGHPGSDPDFRVGTFLRFFSSDFAIGEKGGNAVITVRRLGSMAGAVSVAYADAGGGSALGAGVDYSMTSGVLTWPDGDGADKTFSVSITADSTAESIETVRLILSNPTGGAGIDGVNPATLTITDSPGAIQFASSGSFSGKEALGSATITLQRIGGKGGSVSVTCGDAGGGSATPTADYVLPVGPITWADGDLSDKTFAVTLKPDLLSEGDESVKFILSNPTGGAVLGATQQATLVVGDSPGTLQFSSSGRFSVDEAAGSAMISVQRIGGKGGPVSVAFADSAGGRAMAGFDYTVDNGAFSWSDGDASEKTFLVTILDDGVNEDDETVTFSLSNVTGGALIGGNGSATLTIVNRFIPPPTSNGGGGGGCSAGSGRLPGAGLLLMVALVGLLRIR